jgi:hypothetical protein
MVAASNIFVILIKSNRARWLKYYHIHAIRIVTSYPIFPEPLLLI